SLKLTIQKFYRVTGGSTQLRGVTPDIVLTDMLTYADISESRAEDALPWDQIKPVKFDRWSVNFDLEDVKAKSANRLKGNAYLELIEKGARYYQELDKIDRFPLSLEKYKENRNLREQKSKQFDSIDKYKTRLKVTSPAYELPRFKNDTILRERRKVWHNDLSNDFYLEESVNVLKDIS